MKHHERAASGLTTVVFGLIFLAVFYCAYTIIPFFYYYMELQNQMDAAARVAGEYKDKELRQRLWYEIKKMDLPVDPEDLKIERLDGRMKISMDYVEVFSITIGEKEVTLWEFPFHASADRKF